MNARPLPPPGVRVTSGAPPSEAKPAAGESCRQRAAGAQEQAGSQVYPLPDTTPPGGRWPAMTGQRRAAVRKALPARSRPEHAAEGQGLRDHIFPYGGQARALQPQTALDRVRRPRSGFALVRRRETGGGLLTWPIEISLDMQIRAKRLQRTLGGGWDRGLIYWNG